jgi:hypothetical protein
MAKKTSNKVKLSCGHEARYVLVAPNITLNRADEVRQMRMFQDWFAIWDTEVDEYVAYLKTEEDAIAALSALETDAAKEK